MSEKWLDILDRWSQIIGAAVIGFAIGYLIIPALIRIIAK